jgi:uncharacterized UPF0160 family protein
VVIISNVERHILSNLEFFFYFEEYYSKVVMQLIKEGEDIDTNKLYKRIGTHDGDFHADEVVATSILKEIFEVELVRTRDEEVLSKLDIVYDVGGGEFDHHGTEKVYREDGIPYAACGLIWNRFGREVVRSYDPELEEDEVDSIFSYIDRVLIKGIDALDNGVRIGYLNVVVMNITAIISGFNVPWDIDASEDDAFNKVVEVISTILKNTLNQRLAVLRAKNKVIEAYERRETRELLILDKYCPYGEALQSIDDNKEVLFVIYPRKDSFAIQTVRGSNREDRKKLPKAWAGKRDQELAEVTGVQDAVFCHTGRFIAVTISYDGILKLAQLAIKEEPEDESEATKEKLPRGIWRWLGTVLKK